MGLNNQRVTHAFFVSDRKVQTAFHFVSARNLPANCFNLREVQFRELRIQIKKTEICSG